MSTNIAIPTPPDPSGVFERFHFALRRMAEHGASDLHVSVGSGFRMRLKGELLPVPDAGPIAPPEIFRIAAGILIRGRKCSRDEVGQFVESLTDYDCSYSAAGLGRYRVNIASQRRSLTLVLRHIPVNVPTIESLGLPKAIADIALTEHGLVLLTGANGSGKSTTLAAMINHVNHLRRKKIVTIEDPIEFLHRDMQCCIIQRECGTDTASFAKGLQAALRQDPDIILADELRDKETIGIALKAVEMGHVVMSTVHTPDVPKTISRILGAFDISEQHFIRRRLSESLVAVISQRLLRRYDGTGCVVACEIMRQSESIQQCIADPKKTESLHELIQKGFERDGMQTFEQHMAELRRTGLIAPDDTGTDDRPSVMTPPGK